ncbi:MAG: hypothetical protein ABSB70_14695 [Candidatus Velthaea sp.]|jgi:hypothetical protein
MIFARVFWPLLGCAALAACSGNIGGGQSTLPGTLQNGTNPQGLATGVAATPTPSSASNVATVGANPATQALPTVAGWGGSIAFAKPSAAPSASPNPKASSAAADAGGGNSASIGVTASVVEPSDAPHFSAGSKRHSKHDAGAPTALFFISLLAPSDIAFAQYPKIAVDVPRDVIAKHRDDVFALALYDPERKDKTYRLAVAERDLSSPGPQSLPSATPVPTPMPTPFGMSNGAQAFTPPPIGMGVGSAALPPEHIAFLATPENLTLRANRPVVFALYAVAPAPSPSPSPSLSPSSKATASAAPAPALPSAVPSPSASP